MAQLLAFAVALATVLALVPLIRRWAGRIGFVDRPARRKVHARPMPLGGGLAIAAGALGGVAAGAVLAGPPLLAAALLSRPAAAVLAGLVASVALGLRDDRAPLPPLIKLAGQAAAAAILVLGAGHPEASALGGLGVPIAMLGTVALMNACNFLDNMDGVLGGIALLCAAALAFAAPPASPPASAFAAIAPLAASATAGAAAGFLAFNFPPARIFMGDAGSLALGFLLAAAALAIVPSGLPLHPGLGVVLILGYPLFDLTFVTVTRLIDGRRIWTPGQDHSSHRLNRLLGSARKTALAIYGLTALVAAAGVALCRRPGRQGLVLALVGGLLLFGLGVRLARVPRAEGREP